MREADREDALVVALTRDGRIFLGADAMDRDRLAGTLKNRLADQLMKTVYVKSDRRARYGEVAKVVDTIREAGTDTLGLLTDKIEDTAAPRTEFR
jgi:biopolymer transport protein ExbD/biopolymer transport protein TolR